MDSDLGGHWPECLGVFDEESCRYFLHQIGSRTVPNYPFSFGMEEVYSLILDKYRLSGMPDATSLLQELLEDSRNATGLGDDGDIWRSWRHGWRHRNNDALNPFIPHVGSILLPPPTDTQIRKLKAENFSRNQDIRVCSVRPSRDQKECSDPGLGERESIMSILTPLSLPTKIQLDVLKPDGTGDETDESSACCDRYSTCTVHFDPRLPAVCETAELPDVNCGQSPAGRDGILEFWDHASPLLAKKSFRRTYRSKSAVVDASCCADEPDLIISEDSGLDIGLISSDPHPSTSQRNSEKSCAIPLVRSKSTLKSKWYPPKSGSPKTISGATESSAPQGKGHALRGESNKRAQNREARLIDGTIFVSRSRRSKTVSQQQVETAPPSERRSRTSSTRSSWSPQRQRDSLRSRWTHEIRFLFHRDRRIEYPPENTKHQSVPACTKTQPLDGVSKMSNKHNKTSTIAANVYNTVQSQFGLDGASDVPVHQGSPFNLNKPLPLNPEDVVKSMSSRTQTLTSHYSDSSSTLPSAASTMSSLSNNSSRKDSRGLTRHFLDPAMPPQHELLPIREVSTDQGSTAEPQKSPREVASRMTYSSISQANPFIDDETSNQYPQCPSPPVGATNDKLETKVRQTSSPLGQLSNPLLPKPARPVSPQTKRSQAGSSPITRSRSTRGRKSKTVTPSTLEQKNETPNSTAKRSRSPIKRILGLVKSGSGTKVEEKEIPVRPATPGSSSKKDSLKKWGDRIRYGFLTADQEQLRQEELLEQHHTESTSSTPQKSNSPISLDPPLQAKVQSEIELILSVTANRYLLHEAGSGRLSAESIARTKEQWEKMSRPQVVEFLYDSITQHNLVMANMDRIKLHGDAARDAIAINSTMRGWKTLAREMSIRTFCSPDSVIRKHLHDAHRVLELLGAPLVTFLAYEEMQLKTLSTISHCQKDRVDRRRAGSHSQTYTHARNTSNSSQSTVQTHRRNLSEGSQQQYDYSDYPITALQMDKISFSPTPAPFSYGKVRKVTGAEGAVMSLPTNFERSRDRYRPGIGSVHTDTNMYSNTRGGETSYGAREMWKQTT